MRLFAIGLLILASAAACVKGTPGNPDVGNDGGVTPVFNGGSVDLPGCGFKLTTISGAEAPMAGGTTFGSGTDADPYQVHLGFGGSPTTTIAMVWRTDLTTDVTQVKFGVGAALDQTASGYTYRYVAGLAGDEFERVHEAHLCGLLPDTQYSYQVGGTEAGVDHWSPTYTFRTAPDVIADPSAEVRIAIVGDSRGGYDIWQSIATQIKAQGVDLVMFSGDAVTIGQIQDEWDEFFTAAGDLAATVPMMSAMGNHDLNSVNYFSLFAMPGDESNYSFDYGHAHMTVLNDSPVDTAVLAGSTKTFLDTDLGATQQVWKIVNHHRPMWSSGTGHGGDASLRALWQPVVDAHHADLVLNGHDHIYERTKVLNGNNVVNDPSLGTVYVVSGGAGAELYAIDDPAPFYQEVAQSANSFGILTINQTMLQADMYHPGESTPFDTFAITK